MCLAIPGKIIEIVDEKTARADFMGVEKKVALDLTEGCRVGDYVIVHAGFAIARLDEKEANETLVHFKELRDATGGLPRP